MKHKELKYYIESWTPPSETAKVFVRIPRLYGHETKHIYVGYGNHNLSSLSDVRGKYEVYENFNNVLEENWVINGKYYFDTLGIISVYATDYTSRTIQLYLKLKTPLRNFIAEFSGYIPGTSGDCYGGLTLVSNLEYTNLQVPNTPSSNPIFLMRGSFVGSSYRYLGTDIWNAISASQLREYKIKVENGIMTTYYPPTTLVETAKSEKCVPNYLILYAYITTGGNLKMCIGHIYIYKTVATAPTITFTPVADITEEFTNPEVDSGIICVIGNVVRQLAFHDYDFKKIIYEVGYNNAYWRVPGSTGGIYVWGKLEMRPLYGEDVSFVDNLYANDAYFYTFTDYQYDVHDKLDVEGVLYDIKAIQVHDAGRETIYKTLVLKRQPEYYACCVGVVS